jgi:hypothetical protein
VDNESARGYLKRLNEKMFKVEELICGFLSSHKWSKGKSFMKRFV